MSATFTISTRTVTFGANETSWAEPATAEVSTRGFPGGDSVAISLGGQREITRTFGFECDSIATFKLLRSMRGRQGSLTVGNWDTTGAVGAVLRSISPNPPANDGRVFGTLQFVLTDL
jgi:hypothetical protein